VEHVPLSSRIADLERQVDLLQRTVALFIPLVGQLNEELARSVDPGSDRSALHAQIELDLQKAASEFFQSGRLEGLETEPS
jgi:hypothetical protein